MERFDLQDTQTPSPGTLLRRPKTPDEIKGMASITYRELIGLAPRTPSTNKLAQFLANPRRAHLDVVLRVLRYLNGMKHRSLHIGGVILDVACFLGGYHDGRKSTGTYVLRLVFGSVSAVVGILVPPGNTIWLMYR